jgi:hypothetical protein
MSANIDPLNVVLTKDPIINLDNKRVYAVLRGGAEISYKRFVSTSFSTSTVNLTCPPPNPGVIVSRRVLFNQSMRLTFTGNGAGTGNLIQAGYDALRAMPLSSVINVLNVTLNNTSVSINMSDVISGFLRYNNDGDNKHTTFSMSPSCLDQAQRYADLIGTNRNPLSTYAEGSDQDVENRGAYDMVIVSNTPTQAVIDVNLTEPLFLSPFLWQKSDKSGFIGLQNIDINITYNSDLSRLWSRATNHPNTGLTNIAVSFNNVASYSNSAPALLFKYITPPATMMLPNAISYPFSVIDRFPTDFGSIPANSGTVTLNSQNIQFQGIPKKIYIYVRRSNNTQNVTTTDTFFSIEKVNVNFNNRAGLLSSASKQDLYEISRKNGCQLSWMQWSGYAMTNSGTNFNRVGSVGSVLCLCPGTDLSLGPLEAPGLLSTLQFQIDVEVRNVNQVDAIVPTLYIVPVYEGTFSVISQRSITQTNVLTKQDVLNADEKPQVSYEKYYNQLEGSGDFLGDLKYVMDEPWDRLIKPVGKELLPLALSGAKKFLGLGAESGGEYMMEEMEGEGMMRKMKGKGAKSAGILLGGAKMSRAELKNKLNRM